MTIEVEWGQWDRFPSALLNFLSILVFMMTAKEPSLSCSFRMFPQEHLWVLNFISLSTKSHLFPCHEDFCIRRSTHRSTSCCFINLAALLHLLQHPDLGFGSNALLMDTLLVCLPKPQDTHGRLRSRPRTSGSKFISSKQQSNMSEIRWISVPIGQLVLPTASEQRITSSSLALRPSFAEIVKCEKTKKSRMLCWINVWNE